MSKFIGTLIGYLIVGGIAFSVVLIFTAYFAFAWGLAFHYFWSWFILPVFTDLPVINLWESIGLMFFITMFKHNSRTVKKDEEKKSASQFTESLTYSMLHPWLVLLIGYIFYSFIK